MGALNFDRYYELVQDDNEDPVTANTYREAWDELVPEYGVERVWSVIDSMNRRGTLYALPGVHLVNVVYYVVTVTPVRPEHEDREFIF